MWICSNCKNQNTDNNGFCAVCGTKRQDAADSSASGKWKCTCGTENDNVYIFCCTCGTKRPDASTPSEDNWQCTYCGEYNDIESSFCTKCGKPRQWNKPPVNGWKCSKCGNTNGNDVQFCTKCGKKNGGSGFNKALILGIAVIIIAIIVVVIVAKSKSTPKKNEIISIPEEQLEYMPPYVDYEQAAYVQPEYTPEPVAQYRTITTNISRDNRDWQHYFNENKLHYNVFKTGEVKNCYAFHMEYCCTIKNPECGNDATGTRILYVRDKENEDANNWNGWIEVGRFSYNSTTGETVTVDINWDNTLGPLDVYSMAVDIDKDLTNASYSSNWGDYVTLYSYEYY